MADENTSSATATVPATSEGTETKVGSETTQPDTGAQVESTKTEGKGNTGSSDGGDGADTSGGERQRPARSERRISELANQVKELQAQLAKQNPAGMFQSPINTNDVKLPEYDGANQITPEQYKSDLINTADQIFKLRGTQMTQEILGTVQQLNNNNAMLQDLEYVRSRYNTLNPDSEDFDAHLDKKVSKLFGMAKPGTRLRDIADEVMEDVVPVKTKSKADAESTEKAQKKTAALRSTGSKTQKAPEDMTADELETLIKSRR